MKPGKVFSHVGQAFPGGAYDYVIVGGGRLGLAVAFYLRRAIPEARVLIVEQSGIPSEGGALLHARGVWHSADLPPGKLAQATWARQVWQDPEAETGTRRPHDPRFQPVGWARALNVASEDTEDHFHGEGLALLEPQAFLSKFSPDAREQLGTLLDWSRIGAVQFDAQGGYGSATSLALSYGYGAVRLGADLLLNTEARLHPGAVELRRLDITPRMEVVVAQTLRVPCAHLIVAAGSEGPALLESDLGLVCPHGRAYAQFPRLELPPAAGIPVISRAGFTVRSGEGGFRVLPAAAPGGDPPEYQPCGGRLTGVPVGVRREILDELLLSLPDWPAFEGGALNLGKTVVDVPGGWEARPRGGWPLWRHVADNVTLLLGGLESDRLGLPTALDLAYELAGIAGRPWHDV
ncbi:FAD-dependent oxidoreductase [Deinococcus peraridilitoris]|uniref:FAD dependent oxidoreductase n=1 Tax=Deinococcus peraridilitoris (strain DSM 19664 / LMG 22246 / CIP 109416 / KR-200) TaxID=937777 RepID=K9ZXU5_DEIPD|nr:FAD-dependent oxidoreductase [Deinococcus peraridilitoris]AFZ66421.1 FAD dependent oxidoreductase [Deinococcus peraridilitoris DSM 19664]